MQLFTGHDIIISRSIREAQKNKTFGSLTSLRRTKKEEIAGGVPHIYPLSFPHHVLLCPRAHRGIRKLCRLVSLLRREDGWYLFGAVFIIQANGWYCIYRCSDLC